MTIFPAHPLSVRHNFLQKHSIKYDIITIIVVLYMADLSKSFHPYKMTIQTINKIF